MTENSVFVDTNVLVYAFDLADKNKKAVAESFLEAVTGGQQAAVVSNQILAELFFVLTRKMKQPTDKETAQSILEGLISSQQWKKGDYTTNTVKKAVERTMRNNTPFWDALIIETMLENKIYTILTENTKDFFAPHIRAQNPFKK